MRNMCRHRRASLLLVSPLPRVRLPCSGHRVSSTGSHLRLTFLYVMTSARWGHRSTLGGVQGDHQAEGSCAAPPQPPRAAGARPRASPAVAPCDAVPGRPAPATWTAPPTGPRGAHAPHRLRRPPRPGTRRHLGQALLYSWFESIQTVVTSLIWMLSLPSLHSKPLCCQIQ